MHDASHLPEPLLLHDAKQVLKRPPTVEQHRQTESHRQSQLAAQGSNLALAGDTGNSIIEPDFSDGDSMGSIALKLFQETLVIAARQHGVETEGRVNPFLLFRQLRNSVPALRADPRNNELIDPHTPGIRKNRGKSCGKGWMVKVTMGIYSHGNSPPDAFLPQAYYTGHTLFG
jgi:hypothetical protein